jgi:ferric-dicitrate binding protein FerR (iron transport regulator)
VVRTPGQHATGVKDRLFLQPGDELRYNTGNRLALIQPSVHIASDKTAAIKNNQDALSFTRAPLPDVFEKLMLQYHTTISYNKNAVAAMNFTGTIAPADSLAVVLHVIAHMNGLTATAKDGGFDIETARL